ncbi:HSP20 family protein [Hydrogenispora ethanolica]|uniref:HSP20 family protein n=1 Tax=Hydrogenispora ethanolica TaxID=1082276 RepID=A0A4R1R3B8_HYDET|nr:Hsp20/alpha crystallin family protein [Hydrogenispora ethanolica]TCL59802.1 HSP20 family protein [Hydrogenispora ethanolica]
MEYKDWFTRHHDIWNSHALHSFTPRFFNDLLQRDVAPFIDLHENEREVVLIVDIPGVRREDLELSVSPWQVILQSRINAFENRPSEGFYQAVQLPAPVVADQAALRYHDGFLEVRLPKVHSEAGRRAGRRDSADPLH